MIKAVLLDLDDTLMPEMDAEQSTLEATCKTAEQWAGIPAESVAEGIRRHSHDLWLRGPAYEYCRSNWIAPWECLWARFEGENETVRSLRQWSPIYRQQSWENCLAELGVNDIMLASHLDALYVEERGRRHAPYPETNEVVARLLECHSCLVVTNGASCVQRDKMRGSGLDRLLPDAIVSADLDVAVSKPDPAIFQIALARLGCQPHEAVMVGDSWQRDIVGALRIGMAAIFVDRGSTARVNALPLPDVRVPAVSGLEDLFATIKKLSS